MKGNVQILESSLGYGTTDTPKKMSILILNLLWGIYEQE